MEGRNLGRPSAPTCSNLLQAPTQTSRYPRCIYWPGRQHSALYLHAHPRRTWIYACLCLRVREGVRRVPEHDRRVHPKCSLRGHLSGHAGRRAHTQGPSAATRHRIAPRGLQATRGRAPLHSATHHAHRLLGQRPRARRILPTPSCPYSAPLPSFSVPEPIRVSRVLYGRSLAPSLLSYCSHLDGQLAFGYSMTRPYIRASISFLYTFGSYYQTQERFPSLCSTNLAYTCTD